jgi:hypothetical protein
MASSPQTVPNQGAMSLLAVAAFFEIRVANPNNFTPPGV